MCDINFCILRATLLACDSSAKIELDMTKEGNKENDRENGILVDCAAVFIKSDTSSGGEGRNLFK